MTLRKLVPASVQAVQSLPQATPVSKSDSHLNLVAEEQAFFHAETFEQELLHIYRIFKSKNLSVNQDRIIQSFSRQLEPKHIEKLKRHLISTQDNQFKSFVIEILSRNQSDAALVALKTYVIERPRVESEYALQAEALQGISIQSDMAAARLLLSEVQSRAQSSFIKKRAAQLKQTLDEESLETQKQ